jgi:RNA-splicing ligase RtcB
VHDRRRPPTLVEEAPAVYRDIGKVIDDEADFVEPLARLGPLVLLKGRGAGSALARAGDEGAA